MLASLEYYIKSSLADRYRKLTINEEYVAFDDKNLIYSDSAKISRFDIAYFRFGIKPIMGYRFCIGRTYCIDIKSSFDNIIKIRLISLYGVRKKMLGEKYLNIVNSLYKYYFDDISKSYLKLFKEGIDFKILDIIFTTNGIIIDKKIKMILWNDVGAKSYSSYFSIFSKQNPLQYKAFEYIAEWNAWILNIVVNEIIESKAQW